MIIYNMFPTLAGRFLAWLPHLKRASSMGFDWVFVNPVQSPGLSGSIYSIKDYYALNPLLVDTASPLPPDEQLSTTIREAGALGLSVMTDLVVNHCAIDSRLVSEHPGWFVHDKEGNVMHPFAMDGGRKVVWGDLAKFDHKSTAHKEALYKYFYALVEHLIGLGFRGFRCDAAYQIPVSFWRKLIRKTKAKHPGVVFAAETLGCSPRDTLKTARAGFDYIFNSSKWWDFKGPWLMEQYRLVSPECPGISFPESHDTVRLAEEFQGDEARLRRNYLFSALFSAGVMITQGFEHGFRKRLDVVRTRPSDMEDISIDLSRFITEINMLKKSSPLLNMDASMEVYRHKANENILLMAKKSPKEGAALVAINTDTISAQRFRAGDINTLSGINGNVLFHITGDGKTLPSTGTLQGGLDIMLGPGSGAIFMQHPAMDPKRDREN